LYALKKSQDADHLLTKYIKKYGETDPDNIAAIYVEKGDRDYAFKWLNKAYEQRAYPLVNTIRFPMFKPFYSDTRWKDFLCKLKLPEDHWLIESLDEPCQDKGDSRL